VIPVSIVVPVAVIVIPVLLPLLMRLSRPKPLSLPALISSGLAESVRVVHIPATAPKLAARIRFVDGTRNKSCPTIYIRILISSMTTSKLADSVRIVHSSLTTARPAGDIRIIYRSRNRSGLSRSELTGSARSKSPCTARNDHRSRASACANPTRRRLLHTNTITAAQRWRLSPERRNVRHCPRWIAHYRRCRETAHGRRSKSPIRVVRHPGIGIAWHPRH